MEPVHSQLASAPPIPTADPTARVTTLLGDTVVRVDHLAPPQPRSARQVTVALGIAGAILLAVSAISFAKAVSVAGDNKRALAAHTDAGKPAHSFRPRRMSVGYDVLTFGGLLGGIAALGLGLARTRSQRGRPEFTIGSSPDADANACVTDGGAPAARFPLVALTPAGPHIRIPDGVTAQVTTAEGAKPLAATELLVPSTGRVVLTAGLSRFHIERAAAPRRQVALFAPQLERRVARALGVSVAAHVALLAILWSMVPDRSSLALEEGFDSARLARFEHKPTEPAPTEPEPETEGGEQLGKGEEPGPVTATGQKGTMGTPEASGTSGKMAVKQRGDEPRLAQTREAAVARARRAGILGVLPTSSPFQALNATAQLPSGWDSEDVAGGMDGEHYAAIYGPGGTWGSDIDSQWLSPYQRRGLITSGRYDTIGGDPNGDPRYGGRTPGKGLRKRKAGAPDDRVKIGTAITPDYDKALIRRYVRRKLARITACYERQLLAQPNLSGTVKVSFTISGNGSVLSARTTGMSNAALHGCISQTIASIQFPRTPDGSSANVVYPFHLRRAGT